MIDIDVRGELNKVVTGEVAWVNLMDLSRKSGYTRDRLVEIAKEMGLSIPTDTCIGKFRATKSVGFVPYREHQSQKYRGIEENAG